MDWGCCSYWSPCADGEGDCDSDSDCMSGNCSHDVGYNYGVSYSFDVCEASACMPANLDWSCCTWSSPCADGEGDCDSDSDCMSGTSCSHDVGSSYGVSWSFDVCEASGCSPSNLDWSCCTWSSPCANGEGDCDSDSDCISGHCAHDVGSDYGVSYSFDVCEAGCSPMNMDWSCCTYSSPCAVGEGDCDYDSDCLTGNCVHNNGLNYGATTSFDVCEADCAPANMDWSCCTPSGPCKNGDGDCDYDSDCLSGYCSHNVGLDYGATTSFDVCETGCDPVNMDWSCCTPSRPCATGEGDCDYDSDCLSGTACSHNVGLSYGATTSFDVCEAMAACDPRNLDWGCCTSSLPCANGEGDCDYDTDCMSGYCSHDVGMGYGVSWSFDVCDVAPTAPPSLSPTPRPTPAPVTPAPTPGATFGQTCKDIAKNAANMTPQDLCTACGNTGYCKAKYKKRQNKCKCKRLKCKKCKKDQTCCATNPEGPCVYDAVAKKCDSAPKSG